MPHMLAFIIVLLIVGLIAGALARLLVPGRDPIGLLGTIVLGVLGSFLGGFILNLIEYHALHRPPPPHGRGHRLHRRRPDPADPVPAVGPRAGPQAVQPEPHP